MDGKTHDVRPIDDACAEESTEEEASIGQLQRSPGFADFVQKPVGHSSQHDRGPDLISFPLPMNIEERRGQFPEKCPMRK